MTLSSCIKYIFSPSNRKLLCGEEARLSSVSVSDPQIPLPHIYHQSPVYTLPGFSRPGFTHRRAYPKYKFVEEIITETTREIEMSVFEETGSEEMDAGKYEQDCGKSEKGGSEEEGDHKDSREDGENQMSESQQSQVASDEKLENEADDSKVWRIIDVEENRKGQTHKEESEKTAVLLSGENMDTENVEHKKEKETAEVPHQTDVSSELHDLKVGGTRESEEHLIKSDQDEQDLTNEEKVISAKNVKHADETIVSASEEDNKTLQHGSVIQVQERANKLTGETTTEECVDITEVPSTAARKEVKKMSHMEQKESTNAESGKVKEGDTKKSEDTIREGNKDQDKSQSPKSIEKAESQQPGGDKTKITSSALQKEKTSVSAETKELQQASAASSQIQT